MPLKSKIILRNSTHPNLPTTSSPPPPQNPPRVLTYEPYTETTNLTYASPLDSIPFILSCQVTKDLFHNASIC